MSINVLVLSGDGINCEIETAFAFKEAGAKAHIIPTQDFLEMKSLDQYDILAIPGGFSYGDEIRSGKILAENIKHFQMKNINKFIDEEKPIIGICNGFQILSQLGVFDHKGKRTLTLSENNHSTFINKWSSLKIIDKNNLWLKDLPDTIDLPIRHKEGNLTVLDVSFRPAITYKNDENGSFNQVAGVLNDKGNVIGLMPHPEAAIHNLLLPHSLQKTNQENIALSIFKNAVSYMKGLKNEH